MDEIQIWVKGKYKIFLINDILPRIGEHFVINNTEYAVKGIVHYIGSLGLNRPHIRLYCDKCN